jgi:hypothetical protein
VAAIPLGRLLPAASSNQPGRPAWKRAWRERLSSLFGFAPGGVYRAVRIATSAVRSYRTLSPLPRRTGRSAFCGTFPRVTPAGRYPAPCFHGARTFLPGRCPERPPGRLTEWMWGERPVAVKSSTLASCAGRVRTVAQEAGAAWTPLEHGGRPCSAGSCSPTARGLNEAIFALELWVRPCSNEVTLQRILQ